MSRTLLVMAAGTGGHVMPGLAIARVLAAKGWRVAWMGTPAGMERRLVAQAATGLSPGGALALEIGAGQADATAVILRAAGFDRIEKTRDLGGIERVVSGRLLT